VAGNGAATLLLVAGPPGVGKTTLARAVGKRLGWTVLDKDTLKSCLLDLGAPEAIAGPASYELLLGIARDALSIGLPVILDCPAHHRSFLDRCAALAAEFDSGFRILLCLLDRDERVRRMGSRTARASQWTVLDEGQETDSDEWIGFFPGHAVVVWLDKPVGIMAGQAIEALGIRVRREREDG
jgi:predicted kinase